MDTKITYKGRTTELSDKLLEAPVIRKNKPKKSYKFGALSLYYDGKYYFPNDIKESKNNHCNRPYEIQVIYYQGKWYQDTFYITKEFKDFLLDFV